MHNTAVYFVMSCALPLPAALLLMKVALPSEAAARVADSMSWATGAAERRRSAGVCRATQVCELQRTFKPFADISRPRPKVHRPPSLIHTL